MKITSLVFVLLLSAAGFSQQKFSKEFSFVNDNDLYASISRDQYYSNGLFFTYRFLASDFKKFSKKIYELEVGHEIYSPWKSTVRSVLEHDRPFAAHLYGRYGITRVFKDQSILKTSLSAGVIGEDALGQELQDIIHDIYNFVNAIGWEFQIQNMFSLNLDATYIKALGTDESNRYDINFIANARLGTTFNEVTGGFKGRLGLKELQPLDNSIAFEIHLNDQKTTHVRGIESFFYYETSLSLVAYDATVQGSLFNDNSPLTFDINPLRFDLEIGYRFTSNRWNFGYAYHYHSNKLPNLRRNGGHYYGRVFLGYLFN
jgi:hypothetical protein